LIGVVSTAPVDPPSTSSNPDQGTITLSSMPGNSMSTISAMPTSYDTVGYTYYEVTLPVTFDSTDDVAVLIPTTTSTYTPISTATASCVMAPSDITTPVVSNVFQLHIGF